VTNISEIHLNFEVINAYRSKMCDALLRSSCMPFNFMTYVYVSAHKIFNNIQVREGF